jgi:hypothetical protein
MPKRLVDGDAVWTSNKLANVKPFWFRAEYTNMLPLALADGTFECQPDLVWMRVYAFNRPDINSQDVAAILEEFARVGMLFRWIDLDTGKQWGFWIGIDKDGRLPADSLIDRHRVKTGKAVPVNELQTYLDNIKTLSCRVGVGVGVGRVGKGLVEVEAPPPQEAPHFQGKVLQITKAEHDRLALVYQGLNVAAHYAEADLWLEAHPEKKRSNHLAFMRNWLAKENRNVVRASIGTVGDARKTKSDERRERTQQALEASGLGRSGLADHLRGNVPQSGADTGDRDRLPEWAGASLAKRGA